MIKSMPLNEFLSEYTERNIDNKYRPVAVGRYGIRSRDSIYSKELAKDYSKNKLIFKNTLTIGMGSVQIDIGILSTDETYSVSPAYHTYRINNINPNYLRYCLECRNQDMFVRYVKKGSRQGKTIDLSRWLTYEIPVYSIEDQEKIVDKIDRVQGIIDASEKQLVKLDELVKSRFVEMFGEPIANTHSLPLIFLSEVGSWNSGGTPSRSNPAYFEGDIDWYSAGELNTLYLEGSVEKITQDALENSTAKLFPAGSMLVGMYDTAAFKMGILKWSSASNQACACIEPNNSINIVWLYHMLQIMKPHFLEQRRGIRQKNLNLGMIKSFQIPYASKPEQNRFAAFVAEVDKSKFCIQKSLSIGRKLWTMAQIDAIMNMDFSTQRSL